MKFIHFLFIFLIGFTAFAQDQDSNYKTKTVAVQNTIAIDSVSINSAYFSLKRKDNTIIDSTYYSVDFAKALITLKKPIASDSIIVDYLSYPELSLKIPIIFNNYIKSNKLVKLIHLHLLMD